ncbi:exodeoxyribonuclease VII large subunit [Candidatus Viridilinea mediisalina]|uniref:Exodeoxyribonuclease 7 large subunit n=1 Tax=Candidatus Viridilinea mediisalina TaxID=2024553 RepID=A0A2A6RGA2_9CHLR|nr:exodeoxyribonuclease VII large subunit [Candidatus Viridilinea mediisalina]PDW01908.1 exodeoxyribonuclease VII large subunit [Candidatus Viridilinea mediisalina]
MHQALSVSAVASYLGELLEVHPLFSDLWIEGELSEFKRHTASGHCYFNLKDENALLHGVMWRSDAARLTALPKSGDRVLAHGRLAFYSPRGDLQIYVDRVVPAGVGLLFARFKELKARLEAEGLFAPERKRSLPTLPRRILIVTAPGGAALQDLLTILGRRCPLVTVTVVPCLVQGERAPDSIVAALYRAYALGGDLLILARGGGSLEDLWAFNDEAVARAIFASPMPLISGVGHETDTTIADFVADLRAPTPSAAAELAVPDMNELREHLHYTRMRLDGLVRQALHSRHSALQRARTTVERYAPRRRLAHDRQQVDDQARRLLHATHMATERRRLALQGLVGRLEALSPLATLARGYAVVRHATSGAVLTSPQEAPSGTPLRLTLRDGDLAALVSSDQEDHTR